MQDWESAWKQNAIPVVWRSAEKGTQLAVRLPYSGNNHLWLRSHRRSKPKWNSEGKYWNAPKSWLNDITERALLDFGSIYIIQPYRAFEICASACQNAIGHDCTCSCMGRYHGHGNDGSWFEVTDAFSFRARRRGQSVSKSWAVRKLVARSLPPKHSGSENLVKR